MLHVPRFALDECRDLAYLRRNHRRVGQFVAHRFMTPFWRTYDLVMLWLALLHGLNGARTMIEDYVGARGWRVFSLASLYILGFIFLALGSLVILTFQPVGTS